MAGLVSLVKLSHIDVSIDCVNLIQYYWWNQENYVNAQQGQKFFLSV